MCVLWDPCFIFWDTQHFVGVSAARWPWPVWDRCSHSFFTYIFLSLHSAAAWAKTGPITAWKNDRMTAFCSPEPRPACRTAVKWPKVRAQPLHPLSVCKPPVVHTPPIKLKHALVRGSLYSWAALKKTKVTMKACSNREQRFNSFFLVPERTHRKVTWREVKYIHLRTDRNKQERTDRKLSSDQWSRLYIKECAWGFNYGDKSSCCSVVHLTHTNTERL